MINNKTKSCAVVFGVNDANGIAAAIAIRSGQEGLHVYVVGELLNVLNDVTNTIQRAGGSASAVTLTTIRSNPINALFKRIGKEGYRPVLVTHGVERQVTQSALDTTVAEIETEWRRLCFAGCLIGQAAIHKMLPAKQGTLLFLGHTTATQTVHGAAAFAAAGAGLRSFAQSMAREFGPKGIHVTHVLLADAEDSQLNTNAVADTCWQLHCQHRTAWTQELDVRA